jgi:hypothetical protein
MTLSIHLSNAGYDHAKIIIDNKKLEALDSALDYSSRALELQISDLKTGAKEYPAAADHLLASVATYEKAIEIIEELSGKIYDHLSGWGSEQYREAASR